MATESFPGNDFHPKIHTLILQHPAESDKAYSSARLAETLIRNCTVRVGLSWPNLKKALGRETTPKQWAVLYLGSGVKSKTVAAESPAPARIPYDKLQFVTKDGQPKPRPSGIQGLILLDGNWAQAKALWWRNAWLLASHRAILTTPQKSLYGQIRREPRRECLSTIESLADALVELGEAESLAAGIRAHFSTYLAQPPFGESGELPVSGV